MGRPDPLTEALVALDAGQGVAIATVVGAQGSTPRHLGARMAITADGTQWGTIGGGRIEQVVVERAREVAAGAIPTVVRQHLVRDLAMCCGGSMEVALTPAASSRAALVAVVNAKPSHARAALPIALLTPVDGSPFITREPLPGDPRAHHPAVRDGALVERFGAVERAIIFGLGHVARSLGPILASLGFVVIACDDNETGATDARPAWAADVIETFDANEVAHRLGGFSGDDSILIITRDHAVDQKILEQLIAYDELAYLGMIGSRGKVGRFRKRLAAKGLLDGDVGAARWARIRAPIGLDLGAETPDEIAIAIAAELVSLRRRGAPTVGGWEHKRHHEDND
ncbi:MAG TPA: XdhC family protein [Kofleriaceae bacterium]|jgi:xanthine dehydrogenase accessory factor